MVNTVRLSVVALATLINVAFMAASENLLSLDTAVWPANDTDLMPEEDFDYGSAIAERKKCPASKKCIDAGGSCIKSQANCDGKVDHQGCKGKKCKCCIPYKTTCPSCPTVPDCPTISTSTCAPCTTQPITTTAGRIWSNTIHACLAGYNNKVLGDGISFADCKTACERETDFECRSVDYWPGGQGIALECQLSTADRSSVPPDHFNEPCYSPYEKKNIYAELV